MISQVLHIRSYTVLPQTPPLAPPTVAVYYLVSDSSDPGDLHSVTCVYEREKSLMVYRGRATLARCFVSVAT